jgi:peptidoglycan hydrolase CwlO-like protein
MSSHTHSNLPATENNLRKEFKSLLDDRTRQIAREFVLLERTVNTLENNFAFSDRDKNERIKELEDTVKRGFVGQNKKIDEIESKVRKLEREVREKENSIEDLMKMNSDKENRIRSLERR